MIVKATVQVPNGKTLEFRRCKEEGPHGPECLQASRRGIPTFHDARANAVRLEIHPCVQDFDGEKVEFLNYPMEWCILMGQED